jgi:hypothetical protein
VATTTSIPRSSARSDLHRELARRHEDERARLPRLGLATLAPLEQGQRERRRLPRARRRLAEEVAAREERRDRLALDRRRLFVAELGQRLEQIGCEAEGGEAGGGDRLGRGRRRTLGRHVESTSFPQCDRKREGGRPSVNLRREAT